MKRPYFSRYQREDIYLETTLGALLMLHLRFIQFFNIIVKEFSYTRFHDERIEALKSQNRFIRKKCNINAKILTDWQLENVNNSQNDS